MRPWKLFSTLVLTGMLLASGSALAAPKQGRGGDASPSSHSLSEMGDATLVVVAQAAGADGEFRFTTSGGEGLPGSFTLATSNGTARIAFSGLRANHTYSVSESVPAGWNLTSAACDSGSPSNVTIPAGGTVTCTFANQRLGALVVRVNATGGDALFLFHATGGGLPSSFNVTTHNGTGSLLFHVEPRANLTLAESVPAGWNLTSAACTSGAPALLNVSANETVTCTFENVRRTSLLVRVDARGGDAAFPFNATGPGLPASFHVATANGTGVVGFGDLEPGHARSLSLVPLAGWKRGASGCDQGTPEDVVVSPGRVTTCRFNATRLATLTLVVLTHGGEGSFSFAGAGPSLPASILVATTNGSGAAAFELDPDAAHSVSLSAPAGWRLVASGCTSDAPHALTPAPGERVTCTFTLSRLGEIRGLAYHDRDRDGVRDANEEGLAGWTVFLDADGDAWLDNGERVVLTDAVGEFAFRDLAPGTHSVRHVVPHGWTTTFPASGVHVVTLAEGGVASGLAFADHASGQATPPPNAPPAQGGNPAGQGFWKNWDAHRTYPKETLDAWIRSLHNASAWLLPAGYTQDAEGMQRLLVDSTKQCNRTYGPTECARRKFEAHLLVLRLNVASGRLPLDADARLAGSEAAGYLGLGPGATVANLLDAVEAKAGTRPTRDQYLLMKAATERAGRGEG